MQKHILKMIKRGIPTSLMALLMLVSCVNPSTNHSSSNNQEDDNQKVERVDFNELLKKVSIGYENNFNDSVKISSAVENAKLKNQEINVIIEMEGTTTVDAYLSDTNFDSFPNFYNSKKAILLENEMITAQTSLAANLLKANLIDEVYGNYSTLFNGFYAKTTYGRIDQIRSFSNVKEAYVSTIYNKPTEVVNNDTNVDETTGIYVNDTEYDGSNTIVAVLDSGFDYTHEVFSMDILKPAKTKQDISSVLKDTVAYSLANQDLSIDDVYLSSKVPFAYDYADKKADVFPVESDHGTHVSGIIGGKSDKITGIAPNTQFAWMKVFKDDDGGGDSADILCALEDAVTIGVDAINMSLGAVGGYSVEVVPAGEINSLEERTNKIYEKIETMGVSLLTAAGNEYSSGYQSDFGTNLTSNPESGTISSPGSYSSSLTVASINGTLDPYALINGSSEEAVFFKNAFDSKQVEHKFIDELFQKINDSGLTRKSDGSVDLEYVTIPGFGAKVNYTGLDVKGKIALVKRGNISFEEKLKYANAAGAFAVLIYNNVSGSLSMTVGDEVFIPISLISMDAGNYLAQQRNGVLNFKESYKAGPFMSDFSSWGPLADLTLKPEITAHGGNIYSSILGGDYDSMSGTSMATPNTCGIVLVIRDYVKETWPELSPKEVTQMVNRLLMSTATICLNEVGNPYSPRKQGAGLASLLNSVSTDAYLYVQGIDKTKLELGDDKDKTGVYECSFNIRNISDNPVTYDIGNYTLTETVSSDDNQVKTVAETAYMLNPAMSVKVGNNLTLDGSKVTVPAGVDSTITVTLTLSSADRNYLEENFINGMYVEGYISLKAVESKQVDLSVPFLAFYGDWLKAPMFDKTYYEVDADRANGSISEKDKTKADMYASTPYGKYGEYYMIPLGGYLYEIPDGQDQIAATEDKAAISIDSENSIYQLYTVYLGMLRGAKKLTMTIKDAANGNIVYEKITYNNRKATFYSSGGGIIPYNDDYSFDMFNKETGEIFANNTKFIVSMTAELDYENGANVSNNTFEFSFYVDYETPTLEDVRYITEWDKTEKKNRYYLELDVSDNRYVQAIRPCTIINQTLISLTDRPIPVYQQNANETTTVKIEITDYFADLKNSDYSDTIFFMIDDYALNSNIFLVSLGGCDYEDLKFNESTIEVQKNDIVDLNQYVNFENAMLQGLNWTTSNNEIAIVDDAQVIGLKQGIAILTGTSPSYGISVKVKVKVYDNDSSNNFYITKVNFSGYTTLFTFEDDFEYSQLARVSEDANNPTYSYMPNSNSFEIYPTESFKLRVNIDPWYYDDSNVEIYWTSSNSNYVSVDDEGVVTALKETVSAVRIKATIYIDGKETVFSTSTNVSVKSPFIHSGIVLQYYKGPGGVVEIPDDLGIEYIGEYAFSHYLYNGIDADGYAIRQSIGDNTSTPITKVIVPEGVKIIQKNAFSDLKFLEEVQLSSTVKDIYVSAFENCTSLKTINLNRVVKIENNAFNNCTSLTNVNALNEESGHDLSNVVTVGSNAFASTNLAKIDLIRLRMAGANTFANCTNLKEVTLYPENPLNVNMFANSAIERITIPHKVIPRNAFENCQSISEITFTNPNVMINSEAFKGCLNLNTIHFANDSQSLQIGYNAFENSAITSLNLPSCEVTIMDEAFKGSSIQELVLKENTQLYFEGAPFVSTSQFETITLDGVSSYYELENNLLLNKEKDTLVLVPSNTVLTIPSSVTTIGVGAVAGNKVTTSLTLPAQITSIHDFAFANSSLESIDLTHLSNCDLGEYLFYGCENLETVHGLSSLSVIHNYMFAYSGLQDVTIGDNAIIGYGAFAYCDQLSSIQIGDNTEIGEYAFYHSFTNDSTATILGGTIKEFAFADSNIKVVHADNVTEMGIGAFHNANNLTSVNFDELQVIPQNAFQNATALNTITFNNVTTISRNAFANTTALTTVNAPQLITIDNRAFQNATNLSTIDLSHVTEIGNYAFENCVSLTSIDLNSIENLGQGAFAQCYNLAEVNHLEKAPLTVIPSECFYMNLNSQNTSLLSSINLSNILQIGEEAFYGNTSLVTVDLSNVETVSDYAFFGTKLNALSLDKATKIGNFAFYATPIRTLSIPSLVEVGECAFAETNASKVDLPETLSTIHYGSFSSIRFLSNFTHNDEINYVKYNENNQPVWLIDDGVLYVYLENGNLQLQSYPVGSDKTSYTILEGTTRIDAYSFYTTSTISLNEIYFPSSLQRIGDCAFAGCETIKTYHFSSYNAPILEGVYNSSLQNYIGNLQSSALTETLDNLYHINHGKVYNMYFYYYPYYYANFYDYVGFVDDLTMYYPSNGNGYDSWIYRNYFANRITNATVADDNTKMAIDALNNLTTIQEVTNDNKEEIMEAYNLYKMIIDEEQKALLDTEQVKHLLDLYEKVMDIDMPPLTSEEISQIQGIYKGVDDEETTFEFTIYANGSGKLVVDNKNYDSQDKSLTFDKIRHLENDVLKIITNDNDEFTFTINEDGSVTFNYYVSSIQLTKDNENVEPIQPEEPTQPKSNNVLYYLLGFGGALLLIAGIVLVIFFTNKKKKENTKEGGH